MASSFGTRIDNLRKRSRVLLSCLEERSKIVRKEVKKLRLKNSSISRFSLKRNFISGNNCEYCDVWKLRNDSSGVGAALCPDYFRLSPKYESHSVPDMNGNGRTSMKSNKNYEKYCSPPRHPVKECYCYNSLKPETRKTNQRSARTRLKNDEIHANEIKGTVSAPESGRINLNDLCHGNEEQFYSPPLSSATLRRAQKIDYTPRSKFLRRVQSKVNTLRDSSAGSTARTISPRSETPGGIKSTKNYRNPEQVIITGLENLYRNKKEKDYPRKHNCVNDDKRKDDKIPKKTLLPKKTIVSKKAGSTANNNRRKSLDCTMKFNQNNHEARITPRSLSPKERNYFHHIARKDSEKLCPCLDYGTRLKFGRDEVFHDEPLDSEINNVRKFRDKNYFDTHASDPSLLGSRSPSGSIQQFRLNERLFPEPIGKIHRDDLAVSIPPCATRQKRGIHYFPRNIVKQADKNNSDNNYSKKRRCPSCPLIGHAVDLGALKVSHPSNSLALRFQKGIPLLT